jgi:hypothetical protein
LFCRLCNFKSKSQLTKSKSKLLHKWRFTVSHFVFVSDSLRFKTSNFIFQLNTCGYSLYVTSSLMRGMGCRLQLILVLASALFSGPSPAGLMTKFHCLRFETPPTWRARSLYLYPPRTDWLGYTPKHWASFSSSPTTHRATVELFDPASTILVLVIKPRDGPHKNVFSIITCFLVVGETCPQSCFLARAAMLSPVYTVVTWQWVYMSQYVNMKIMIHVT